MNHETVLTQFLRDARDFVESVPPLSPLILLIGITELLLEGRRRAA